MAYRLKVADDFLDFEEFCKRFSPRVKELVAGYTGDPVLAEDVTQETLLRAYRFRHTYDPARPMWPWLSRIAVRACSNALRDTRAAIEKPSGALARKSAVPTPLTGPAPLPGADPAEHVLAHEGVLETLHPRHKRALVLRYLFGWNYRDIAKHEGISAAGVDSLLRRARDSFRKAVANGETHTEAALVLPLKALITRMRALFARAQTKTTSAPELYLPIDTTFGAFAAAFLAASVAVLTTTGTFIHEPPTSNLAILTAHHARSTSVPSQEVIQPVTSETTSARADKPDRSVTNDAARSIAVTIGPPGGTAPAGPGGGTIVESGKGREWSWRGKAWAQLLPDGPGGPKTLDGFLTMQCDTGTVARTFCTAAETIP